jgi:anti-sigma B factor antagonist
MRPQLEKLLRTMGVQQEAKGRSFVSAERKGSPRLVLFLLDGASLRGTIVAAVVGGHARTGEHRPRDSPRVAGRPGLWRRFRESGGAVMDLQSAGGGLEVEPRDDVIVARFTGPVILSGQAAEAAGARLASLVPDLGRRRLLVDFGNVRSLTSLMLRELVRLNRAAEAAGARLALFGLSPHVREILAVTALNLVLSLYDDEADALRGS